MDKIGYRRYFNYSPYKYWLCRKYIQSNQPIQEIVHAFNIVFGKKEDENPKCAPCAISRYKSALTNYANSYLDFINKQEISIEDDVKFCNENGLLNNTGEDMQQEFIDKYKSILSSKEVVVEDTPVVEKKRGRKPKGGAK